MTIYDWNHIKKYHPEARYAAMDKDGKVYTYKYLPVFRYSFWAEREGVDFVFGPYTGTVFAGDRPLNAEESLEVHETVNKKIGVTRADRRYEMASRTMTTLMTIYPDEPYINLAETAVKIADILLDELEKNDD